MTTQEIREMLDSTITANGKREISGSSLNAALNAILDLVEEGGGSGFGGSAITVILPNDATFDFDNTNEELLENNRVCFEALSNQTEPMLIFMRYLGATRPLAQTAIRLRNLYVIGEGVDFFAFSYPMPYVIDGGIEVFALSSDKFKLNADGRIEKIDFRGYPVYTAEQMKNILSREYHIHADYVAGVLGSSNPRIEFTSDTDVIIYNATGYSGDNAVGVFDPTTQRITIARGWTSTGFGPVATDIVLEIYLNSDGKVSNLKHIGSAIETAAGNIVGLTYESF